jgi:hypothetical protein
MQPTALTAQRTLGTRFVGPESRYLIHRVKLAFLGLPPTLRHNSSSVSHACQLVLSISLDPLWKEMESIRAVTADEREERKNGSVKISCDKT